MARAFSEDVSQAREVSGKSGSIKTAKIATTTVTAPSMKKSHLLHGWMSTYELKPSARTDLHAA